MQKPEPILQENKDRFVMFPIHHKEIWSLYKESQEIFWYPDKVSYDDDIAHYRNVLSEEEKNLLRFVIAAFQLRFNYLTSKLADDFLHEAQFPEARCFYGFQGMMSNIHSEVYSELSGIFLGKMAHADPLLLQIKESASFKKISQWIDKRFYHEKVFAKRLVAYCAIERILFSGLFIGALSFKLKNTMPVFTMLTDFIYADEGSFTDFSLSIYSQLQNKLSPGEIDSIIREAVDINKSFNDEFYLHFSAIGLKQEKIESFNKYIGNELSMSLSNTAVFGNASNPYRFIKWDRKFMAIPPNKKKEQEMDRTISFDADF